MATSAATLAKVKAGSGTDIQVRVRAYLDAGGAVQFEQDWNLPGKPVENGKIKVPKDNTATISFKLKDDTRLDLSFYPDPADAFWANPESQGCPKSAGNGAGAFNLKPPSSSSNGNKLDILDLNPTECDLKYALRFDGKPYTDKNGSYPPFEYDPELRNGGGGTRLNTSFSSTALVGVATIAIAAVIAIVWLAR